MTAPVTPTTIIRSPTDFPRFAVCVWAPEDRPHFWRQSNGLPGFVEFEIYEITGTDFNGEKGVHCYETYGSRSSADTTTNLAEAEPCARGSVKWDGCVNFEVGLEGVMLHDCDLTDVEARAEAMVTAYRLAVDMMGD